MKVIILLVLLSVFSIDVFTQNMDNFSAHKRDSLLIEMAKKAVKKYAPSYYREYGEPIIERYVIKNSHNAEFGERIGRAFYVVSFPYDESRECFDNHYSASVEIWADDGTLRGIMPGNGNGRAFRVNEAERDTVNVKIIPFIENYWIRNKKR